MDLKALAFIAVARGGIVIPDDFVGARVDLDQMRPGELAEYVAAGKQVQCNPARAPGQDKLMTRGELVNRSSGSHRRGLRSLVPDPRSHGCNSVDSEDDQKAGNRPACPRPCQRSFALIAHG